MKKVFPHLLLAVSLFSYGTALHANHLQAANEAFPSQTDFLQHAQTALAELPTHYSQILHTHRDGGPFHAWQRFVAVSSLAGYETASGDARFHGFAQALLADRQGLDGNDDSLWVAEADLDLAALPSEGASQQHAIEDAEAIFKQLSSQYWDETCGGGIWWDHARTYKNAITNELFLDVAARLRVATGNAAYTVWAQRSWQWFAQSGMISSSHDVNDGLDGQCQNNGGAPYSYNQGVILNALLHLSLISDDKRLTNEAVRIAEQALTTRTRHNNGFEEANTPMSVDSQIFRGIFVQAVGHIAQTLPQGMERTHLATWLQNEGLSLWENRFQKTHFNATWEKTPHTSSAQAQITASNLFVAATPFMRKQ